jgi:hypothetical protein
MIRWKYSTKPAPLTEMREVEQTPEENERCRRQVELFHENQSFFSTVASKLVQEHPGKYVAVANGEVFISDGSRKAVALAVQSHPQHKGAVFVTFIRSRG